MQLFHINLGNMSQSQIEEMLNLFLPLISVTLLAIWPFTLHDFESLFWNIIDLSKKQKLHWVEVEAIKYKALNVDQTTHYRK
jgi:hypothetical protein